MYHPNVSLVDYIVDKMTEHPLINKANKLKTSEVRKAIPQACYHRSTKKALLWYGFDLLFFALSMTLIFADTPILVKLLGSVLAGVATATLFVWAHDAAHGTLFKGHKLAEFLGTLFMLPSLNMYRMWSYGHNKVHHGFNSFSPIDWIWRPLTPQQYQELSKFQRFLYRLERNVFTCAFHYLRRVWWEGMLRFNPGKDNEQRQYYRNGKLFSLAYAVIASLVAYHFVGGFFGIILVVVIPFLIFNYFIAMIVYLHHTHPDIPFFDLKSEWSHAIGAVYCSTIVHCSKLSKMLLHNIMTHIPHHLDIRIPFYHLPQAAQALRKEYGEYFHEYRFKWQTVCKIFKQCKLYDFQNKVWLTFEQAKEHTSSSCKEAF